MNIEAVYVFSCYFSCQQWATPDVIRMIQIDTYRYRPWKASQACKNSKGSWGLGSKEAEKRRTSRRGESTLVSCI